MDLRLLRVFKAVADNGGFTASEVALNKSKSAISVDIASLESRLGLRLCERGRSGFALTAEGEAVYEAVRGLIEDLDRFSSRIAATSKQLVGTITLSVIDNIGSVAGEAMVAAIRDYRTRHPNVRLNIQSGSASEVERAVLDRTAKVAISVLPRLVPELETTPLFVEGQLLYCGRAHPLFAMRDRDLTPNVIAQHPIVSLPAREIADNPSLKNLIRGGEANNLDCLILVVLAGVDLGFMPPHYAQRWVEAGDLRPIRPDLYHTRNTFYLLSLRQARQAPVSRELLDTLARGFAAYPPDGQAFVAGSLNRTCDD